MFQSLLVLVDAWPWQTYTKGIWTGLRKLTITSTEITGSVALRWRDHHIMMLTWWCCPFVLTAVPHRTEKFLQSPCPLSWAKFSTPPHFVLFWWMGDNNFPHHRAVVFRCLLNLHVVSHRIWQCTFHKSTTRSSRDPFALCAPHLSGKKEGGVSSCPDVNETVADSWFPQLRKVEEKY